MPPLETRTDSTGESPEVPRYNRLQSRGITRLPPTSIGAPFPPPSSRGGILSLRGRERFPGDSVASQEEALSTGKVRGTPGWCHHSQSPPDVSVHSRETCFPCTASTLKRGSTHTTVARGTALWESLLGKPQGKATDSLIHAKGSVTLLLQLDSKAHLYDPTREEDVHNFPKIHFSTGEESSASGTASTQCLRPRQRLERNPERPQKTRMGTGLS